MIAQQKVQWECRAQPSLVTVALLGAEDEKGGVGRREEDEAAGKTGEDEEEPSRRERMGSEFSGSL